MRINLTDNNNGNESAYQRNEVAPLFPIADKKIATLCKENERLLVFPYSIEESADKVGNLSILSIENSDDSERVRLRTGNVMGFIGVGDLQVKIRSRFDNGRSDYFMHYMLQRVLSFNLFDLSHNNDEEEVFDFIMFLFPYLLKKALRQGLYREYRNYKHNDANIRGAIDVGRHVRHNIPFAGKVAYETREYSCDNDLTELVRHTIEYMKTRKYGQSILNVDYETKQNVALVVENTPAYNMKMRRVVINKNMRHKSHPYYTEYRPLQMLCLQILRMEELKYGVNTDEICGMLFDGAWLWEEYINVVMKGESFKHPKNKERKGRIYLFEDNSGERYPDFYKEGVVLDAKYKKMESYDRVSKVETNDIHQIIAYMNNLRASKGGFIVPLKEKQMVVPTSKLRGQEATISIYGVEICREAKSYEEFCNKMRDSEICFLQAINK